MPKDDYLYRSGNPGGISPLGTAARGPNSPFAKNEIVYIPGIGPRRFSDYGPGVRGADIPVTTREQMRSPAVNRMVNINGRNVPLTGYIPGNPRLDPTGGGKYEAYTGKPIIPWSGTAPGGWGEPVTNWDISTMVPPYEPPVDPNEFLPEGPPSTFEAGPGPSPTDLPSPGGADVYQNQYQEPYQYQPPPVVEPMPSPDYGSPPGPTPEGLPSPVEIPTYEPQYVSPPGENVPTGETGIVPTAAPEGANVPTQDIGIQPDEPGLYYPSTAGANLPTEEGLVSDWPAEYLPSSPGGMSPYEQDYDYGGGGDVGDGGVAPAAAPAPETMSYPDGQGGYNTLDASGNVIDPNQIPLANIPGITTVTPGGPSDLPNMGQLYYDPVSKSWVSRAATTVAGVPGAIGRGVKGVAGTIGNVARDIGTGVRNAINAPGYSSPEYLASIGYEPGAGGAMYPGAAPTLGTRDIGGYGAPSGGYGAPAGGGSFYHGGGPFVGGAFASSPGGVPLGALGRGTGGAVGPWWQRLTMAAARRGRPAMGLDAPGGPIARFAAASGKTPVPSFASIAPYMQPNKPVGPVTAGEAAEGRRGIGGPGGRGMSVV